MMGNRRLVLLPLLNAAGIVMVSSMASLCGTRVKCVEVEPLTRQDGVVILHLLQLLLQELHHCLHLFS